MATTSQHVAELVSCGISPKPLYTIDGNNNICMTNGTNIPRQATEENVTTTGKIQMAPADCDGEEIIQRFISIHAGLTELYPSTQPCERTTALFSELLRLYLRKYNAELEGVLETYWARRMLESFSVGTEPSPSDPLNSGVVDISSAPSQHSTTETQESGYVAAITLLKQYPPYQNYVDIVRLELNAIMSVSDPTDPPRNWAFLGSGPIPLTSICLAQLLDPLCTVSGSPSPTEKPPWPRTQSGHQGSRISEHNDAALVQIHNIDRCSTAIALSSQLCQKLGRLTRCLTFECTEASDCIDLSSFDVVCLAALVGRETVEKLGIIASVAARMRPGALLVLRSAHGMRKLLCAVLEPAAMVQKDGSGIVPLVVVHPWNHVRNSVVVAKVVRY